MSNTIKNEIIPLILIPLNNKQDNRRCYAQHMIMIKNNEMYL